jgi:Fur family ferric uptake transcriptional regulator
MKEPSVKAVKADLAAVQEDLRRRGYRVTPQRETILRVFQDLPEGTHLSAEELYTHLTERDSGISLATAYRTLKLLASIGLLRELDFAEGHKHYELNTPQEAPHHHLVCVSCSQAIEFEGEELYALGLKMAETHGFAMIDVQYKVHGVCPDCQLQGGRR